MWFKAVVMELKDDYAIVLKSDSTMVRVNIKEDMKIGDILIFLEEDIYIEEQTPIIKGKYISREKRSINNKVILTIVSLAAVLALFILPMLQKQSSPYAVVSLDINPSIELELDKNKKIINVNSLNKDGEKLNITNIKGLSLDEGINEIKNILEANGYKLLNDSIIVGFAFLGEGEDIDYEDYIKNILTQSLSKSKVAYLKGNQKDYEDACKKGISLGRYEARLNADEDILEDEIEKMSVEEILSLLNNKNIYLNEEVLEELQDELNDKIEENIENSPNSNINKEHNDDHANDDGEDDDDDDDEDENDDENEEHND